MVLLSQPYSTAMPGAATGITLDTKDAKACKVKMVTTGPSQGGVGRFMVRRARFGVWPSRGTVLLKVKRWGARRAYGKSGSRVAEAGGCLQGHRLTMPPVPGLMP